MRRQFSFHPVLQLLSSLFYKLPHRHPPGPQPGSSDNTSQILVALVFSLPYFCFPFMSGMVIGKCFNKPWAGGEKGGGRLLKHAQVAQCDCCRNKAHAFSLNITGPLRNSIVDERLLAFQPALLLLLLPLLLSPISRKKTCLAHMAQETGQACLCFSRSMLDWWLGWWPQELPLPRSGWPHLGLR